MVCTCPFIALSCPDIAYIIKIIRPHYKNQLKPCRKIGLYYYIATIKRVSANGLNIMALNHQSDQFMEENVL